MTGQLRKKRIAALLRTRIFLRDGAVRNFLIGLALGMLGAILWVVASVVAGLASAGGCLEQTFPTPEPGAPPQFPTLTGCESDLFSDPVSGSLVVVGFLVMLGGPVLFWVVLPIAGWVRRRIWPPGVDEKPPP